MTQATLAAFYTLYTTTYLDDRQATKCETALKQTYGVDTSLSEITNTTD